MSNGPKFTRKPSFHWGRRSFIAGKDRGTGWEDHPEEDDEALGELPKEGIVTLLVEVRGTKACWQAGGSIG